MGSRPSLLDLFEGRRQLITYRFFFEPVLRDGDQIFRTYFVNS